MVNQLDSECCSLIMSINVKATKAALWSCFCSIVAVGIFSKFGAGMVNAADIKEEIFKEKTYQLTIYPEIVDSICVSETTVQPETDYDGSFQSTGNGSSIWTKGEKGYYVRYNEFVYFCSFDAQVMVPLCNKPDCLHQEETNDQFKEECHAYVGNSVFWNMLQYYDGKLYTNTHIWETSMNEAKALTQDYFNGDGFYVLSDDGSTKDLTNLRIANPETELIHRGRLFYLSHVDDVEKGITHYELGYQSLDGKEQKTIAALDSRYTMIYYYPYGDYLYFDIQADEEEEDTEYSCVYDLENDQITVKRKPRGENGPFLPDGDSFIKMPDPTQLIWMDKNGQLTGKRLILKQADGTLFGLSKTPEGWGWYAAMDENYYYILKQDRDIGDVVVVYDRETGETVQYLKTQGGISLEQRIGVTDQYLFFGTYYPGIEPVVYWMEKDHMLESGAQFQEIRP